MGLDAFGELNWWAVMVATSAYYAIGGPWFSPAMFGKSWMELMGWEPGQDPGIKLYVTPIITCFIATVVTALLVVATGTDTGAEAITLGLLTSVGLVGSALFVTGYFDSHKNKPLVWFGIAAGYQVVGLLVATVITALWR
jgi:hypothetical protein